jgi:hypothetical protein
MIIEIAVVVIAVLGISLWWTVGEIKLLRKEKSMAIAESAMYQSRYTALANADKRMTELSNVQRQQQINAARKENLDRRADFNDDWLPGYDGTADAGPDAYSSSAASATDNIA